MKITKKLSAVAIALCTVMLFAVGCGETEGGGQKELDVDPSDKDFSTLRSASAQENAYDYKFNFLPEKDSAGQGYVGDTMPYYENGTYYIYYLKDRGDSYNHSVYLTTTKDFVTYEERQEVVLESDHNTAQDTMIGTGSVVKVGEKYYFFYTGHNESHDPHEAIMVAEGTSPTSFTKKADWKIDPPAALGQRNDFRDPQAYYDASSDTITLTVTASQSGIGRVVKYTLKGDLSEPVYGDVIYTNDETVVGDVYNLECSDTFQIGGKWYLTFSAQDGVLWYTTADTQYGPYTATPKPLDGHLFYAAKHASDGNNTYLIGWSRRSESVSSTQDVKGWAGNLQVQKVVSDGNGGICLAPVDAYTHNTKERVLVSEATVELSDGDYVESFRCFERYMVTGKFQYSGTGDFGFAFDYSGRKEGYKTVSISPEQQTIALDFNHGSVRITSVSATLKAGQSYSFTYIQEGSVGVLYVEGQTAFTVRLYGVSGKNVMLYSEGNSVTFSDLKQFTYTY